MGFTLYGKRIVSQVGRQAQLPAAISKEIKVLDIMLEMLLFGEQSIILVPSYWAVLPLL